MDTSKKSSFPHVVNIKIILRELIFLTPSLWKPVCISYQQYICTSSAHVASDPVLDSAGLARWREERRAIQVSGKVSAKAHGWECSVHLGHPSLNCLRLSILTIAPWKISSAAWHPTLPPVIKESWKHTSGNSGFQTHRQYKSAWAARAASVLCTCGGTSLAPHLLTYPSLLFMAPSPSSSPLPPTSLSSSPLTLQLGVGGLLHCLLDPSSLTLWTALTFCFRPWCRLFTYFMKSPALTSNHS